MEINSAKENEKEFADRAKEKLAAAGKSAGKAISKGFGHAIDFILTIIGKIWHCIKKAANTVFTIVATVATIIRKIFSKKYLGSIRWLRILPLPIIYVAVMFAVPSLSPVGKNGVMWWAVGRLAIEAALLLLTEMLVEMLIIWARNHDVPLKKIWRQAMSETGRGIGTGAKHAWSGIKSASIEAKENLTYSFRERKEAVHDPARMFVDKEELARIDEREQKAKELNDRVVDFDFSDGRRDVRRTRTSYTYAYNDRSADASSARREYPENTSKSRVVLTGISVREMGADLSDATEVKIPYSRKQTSPNRPRKRKAGFSFSAKIKHLIFEDENDERASAREA